MIVFDPSAFAKKGTKSVGVARQWCGRLGKVENCQVGVFMAYVSRKEHALVNTRLYLPKEWTKDRARCKAAGVPKGIKFRTRHELALEMLDEHGALLPHAWVAGDDEMGRPLSFRRELQRPRRTLPAGGAVEHADPRPRRAAAGILGAGAASHEPVRAAGSLVRGAAGARLDHDRGPRRRERSAGGRGREAAGAGADADGRHGPGGVAVRHAGASSGRHVQA